MLKQLIAAMLLAALAAPAFAAGPVVAPEKSDKKSIPCLAVIAGSPQQLSGNGNNGNGNGNNDDREFQNLTPTFSSTKILDIEFAILFSAGAAAQFTNAHMVEFRVYTPQGNLYQSIAIPVTTDSKRAKQRHRVAGYPDLVPVQVLKPVSYPGGSAMMAKVTLPVAGTTIVSNSLYGKWRAEAVVEDATGACGLPAQFTITQ